jgi:hypothetical protein
MLFSCQKSSAFYGVPPGWVRLHLRAAQSSAPSDRSFDRYRKTVVAVDAQLRAVRRACDRIEIETLVELSGIEPLTPWLQTRCSPS